MRKVWRSERADGKGVNVQWYDTSRRRRTKFFSNKHKAYIKPFMAAKFIELNGDCRLSTDLVNVPWVVLVEQYLQREELKGSKPKTIREIASLLGKLNDCLKIQYTKQLTQGDLDRWKLARKTQTTCRHKPPSPHTVNKEARTISAFLVFGKEQGYLARTLAIRQVRAQAKPPRVLTDLEARRLVRACGDDRHWRMLILLLLCTGLRVEDVLRLRISDIDIDAKTLTTAESKSKKASIRPLPDGLIPELTRYLLESVAEGQERLFRRPASRSCWYSIRKRAKLGDVTLHDLRRSYASMQVAAGTPVPVIQKLLSHSSIDTTMTHYVAVPDELARKSVNTLKVNDWL